ncbi:GNAT family protein [Nocardia transvalensis]|uniref:GNAT family N-acetyltransferase n=1 Tax=Nocardia transvalensis TaxID=37333 RepID=UPI002B4AC78B|nr:GNAT family protein [Nocardia transvalensis]
MGLIVEAGQDLLIPLVTTVVSDLENGSAVGQIGLWRRDIRHGRASAGYWIGPAYRRWGYAGRALRLLSSWAVTLEEVSRLELHVEPWNEGSWRAAESAGYQREGLLRSWEKIAGEPRDMYMYARLP